MHLHLLLWKKTFLYNCYRGFHQQGHDSMINGWSFKFAIKLRNLAAIEKRGLINSYLSQIAYILV